MLLQDGKLSMLSVQGFKRLVFRGTEDIVVEGKVISPDIVGGKLVAQVALASVLEKFFGEQAVYEAYSGASVCVDIQKVRMQTHEFYVFSCGQKIFITYNAQTEDLHQWLRSIGGSV